MLLLVALYLTMACVRWLTLESDARRSQQVPVRYKGHLAGHWAEQYIDVEAAVTAANREVAERKSLT